MSVIKKILGKIIYSMARALSVIMASLIQLIEILVSIVKSITKGFVGILSMGGCLLFFLFAIWGFRILMNPVGFSTILFILIFPLIGARFAAYLKYQKYIICEYLFNLANYLMDGINYQYKPFRNYKLAYKKAEEEKKREQQRRYYEQQREFEERFKQQWYQQNYHRGQASYGGYDGKASYRYSNGFATVEFKNKYERSCDVLGVLYDADKDQIKLAYRRKAKEYHPDVNRGADATKKFQEISDAYEFLNDDNIQRYKNI